MAKATLRADWPDAPPATHADVIPLSADELVQEILRLYRQLQALPAATTSGARAWRPSPAYLAIEAQIRRYAAQHWWITEGIRISDDGPPTKIATIRGRDLHPAGGAGAGDLATERQGVPASARPDDGGHATP